MAVCTDEFFSLAKTEAMGWDMPGLPLAVVKHLRGRPTTRNWKLDPTESHVTVMGVEGPHNVNDHYGRAGEEILLTIAGTLASPGASLLPPHRDRDHDVGAARQLRETGLWYVFAMPTTQPNPSPTLGPRGGNPFRDGGTVARGTRPLSEIHAAALYRPVPPVSCDEDGYPHTDDAAVDNSDHNLVLGYLAYALREHFVDRAGVFVDADLGLFFEQGNRAALVVPDLLVALDVEEGSRWSYKLWQEPKPPDFVAEVLSKKSWRKDLEAKPGLYEALDVGEYWTFDQHRVSAGPPLVGRRLTDGVFEVIAGDPNAGHSAALGLDLRVEADRLRLHDPVAGMDLPDYGEAMSMFRQAQARTAEAAKDRQAAERRIAELEELLRARGG